MRTALVGQQTICFSSRKLSGPAPGVGRVIERVNATAVSLSSPGMTASCCTRVFDVQGRGICIALATAGGVSILSSSADRVRGLGRSVF